VEEGGRSRDDNSSTGIKYLPGTRSDGDGHGHEFLPMGGIRARSEPKRVWAWVFFLHSWIPKIKYVSVLSTAGLSIYPHSPQPSLAGRHISGRFCKLILFWQLRVTAILVDHEISDVRKFISLAFQAYVDLSNWRLYVSCVSI
jgi:hypothetical protein